MGELPPGGGTVPGGGHKTLSAVFRRMFLQTCGARGLRRLLRSALLLRLFVRVHVSHSSSLASGLLYGNDSIVRVVAAFTSFPLVGFVAFAPSSRSFDLWSFARFKIDE